MRYEKVGVEYCYESDAWWNVQVFVGYGCSLESQHGMEDV